MLVAQCSYHTTHFLKYFGGQNYGIPNFLVKIIQSNMLNDNRLANEDENTFDQIDFLENFQIYLYSNLFPLEQILVDTH